MPLTAADQRRVDEAEAEAKAAGSSKLLVRTPPDPQKLGSITVMCLMLNRMIGMSRQTLYSQLRKPSLIKLKKALGSL